MLQLTSTQLLAALGLLLVLVLVWRTSSKAARRARESARSSARLASLSSRVLLTAAGIVGLQWIVIIYPGSTTLLLTVLGVPALFAAYTLTKALTVTTTETPRKRGGRR
jgi:hypothetical protein